MLTRCISCCSDVRVRLLVGNAGIQLWWIGKWLRSATKGIDRSRQCEAWSVLEDGIASPHDPSFESWLQNFEYFWTIVCHRKLPLSSMRSQNMGYTNEQLPFDQATLTRSS